MPTQMRKRSKNVLRVHTLKYFTNPGQTTSLPIHMCPVADVPFRVVVSSSKPNVALLTFASVK